MDAEIKAESHQRQPGEDGDSPQNARGHDSAEQAGSRSHRDIPEQNAQHDAAAVDQQLFHRILGGGLGQYRTINAEPEEDGQRIEQRHQKAGDVGTQQRHLRVPRPDFPELPGLQDALHSGIHQHKESEEPEKRFDIRRVQQVNHSEIDQQHVDQIGADRSETDQPGMPESAAEALVQLGGIDRADRSGEREPQQNVTHEDLNDVLLLL